MSKAARLAGRLEGHADVMQAIAGSDNCGVTEDDLRGWAAVMLDAANQTRELCESRAELLEALIRAEKRLRKLSDIDCGCRPCRGVCRTGRGAEAELEGRMETAAEYADETLKAIANATQPPAVGVDVSDEMVERAFNAWCDVAVVDDYRVRNSREAIHAALTAALRTGGGA